VKAPRCVLRLFAVETSTAKAQGAKEFVKAPLRVLRVFAVAPSTAKAPRARRDSRRSARRQLAATQAHRYRLEREPGAKAVE